MPVKSEKMVRCDRRNVAIAGPVYQTFSHICDALDKDRQVEVTAMVHRWNARHEKRAAIRLREKAAAMSAPAVAGFAS